LVKLQAELASRLEDALSFPGNGQVLELLPVVVLQPPAGFLSASPREARGGTKPRLLRNPAARGYGRVGEGPQWA
jgi:hypothetical protein